MQKDINRLKTLQNISLLSALISILLAVLLPLLPVKNNQTIIDWPTTAIPANSTTAAVVSPLATQTAQEFTVTIPASLVKKLPYQNGVIISTLPKNTKDARTLGFFITVDNNKIFISFRGKVTEVDSNDLTDESLITAWSNRQSVGAKVTALRSKTPLTFTASLDHQPQISGIFTDLDKTTVLAAAQQGLQVKTVVDTRFHNTPTPWKYLAIIFTVLSLLISLGTQQQIYKQSTTSSTSPITSTPFRATIKLVDITVYALLAIWLVLAGGSPDDGYLRVMGETAHQNGYLANYYRYFSAPEAPFGWYYQLLAAWSHISTTSIWLRIPDLIIGCLSWTIISLGLKKILKNTKTLNLSLWTAAAVMLVFWFPMASGLRAESVIVLGTVATWYLVEKYLQQKSPTYLAISFIISIFTMLAAPQGIIVLAVLLAASRAIVATLKENLQKLPTQQLGKTILFLPLVATLAIAFVLIYSEQTFASLNEAIRIRYAVGPVLNWADEYMQYYVAFMGGTDGSLVFRLPILLMFACGLLSVVYMLWVKQLPKVSTSVIWRAIGILPLAMLLHLFTPLKWVIQFGIFTGITAILAGITVPMIDALTKNSVRNLGIIITGFAIMLAITMAGENSWYWIWSYSISWYDRKPVLKGIPITSIFVYLAAIGAIIAAWLYVKDEIAPAKSNKTSGKITKIIRKINSWIPTQLKTTLRVSPVIFVAGILVLCELLVFSKAALVRRNSYSLLKDNVATVLKHDTCSMAQQVLVEKDTNDSFLTPLDHTDTVTTFKGDSGESFSPQGFTTILRPYEEYLEHNQLHTVSDFIDPYYYRDTDPGTGGGLGPTTINGSRIKLPFGLNPKTTPFLGTYNAKLPVEMHSGWYKLPARDPNKPLIVISALGNIASYTKYNVFHYGQVLQVEYGKRDASGVMQLQGFVIPIDPGPQIAWRNLRIPMAAIPPDAEAIRILARDQILGNKQWLGFTPPRIPTLVTLQSVVGSTDPVLLDLTTAAQFPCQTPINFHNGIWQVPRWRITPNRQTTYSVSKTWQASQAGGPLFVPETLLSAEIVSTYLRNDWYKLWGTLQKYTPNIPAPAANTTTTSQTHAGWWKEGTIPEAN